MRECIELSCGKWPRIHRYRYLFILYN